MIRTTSLTRLALAAAVIALAGSVAPSLERGLAAQSPLITAKDAFTREAPAGRAVTAVFVTIENAGGANRTIVSGKADAGDTLELHEMKKVGTTMQMSPVKAIDLPAHGKAELKPGGLHIMLFGLKKPLAVGDTVRVTLTLDDGTKVPVVAPVKKPETMK